MKTTKITENELKKAGWKKRTINGIMPEYYREFAPDSQWEPGRWRLAIRFNEFIGETESGRAYLFMGGSYMSLFSVVTLDDMEQLYKLLKFDKWESVP